LDWQFGTHLNAGEIVKQWLDLHGLDEALRGGRMFLECGYALIDILDAELQDEAGMTLRWYDVLVNLEEAEHPVRMNELASRILASKSGLTRVIDRMEEAGLVERFRSHVALAIDNQNAVHASVVHSTLPPASSSDA